MKKERLGIFVMTAPGVEEILARELRSLGLLVKEIVSGGVSFSGEPEHLRRVNLMSRVANRALVRVAEFHASTFHELERRAKKVEWKRFISPGDPVRFRVTCRKSKLYHSDGVASRLLEIAEGTKAGLTAETAENAEVIGEEQDGAQLFVVRIAHDICTISVDSSGELLHRRGYRQAVAKAPLRETLAAAMVIGSEWDMSRPLVDPMCGSGTIPIEAAMIARNIAPGINRGFAFEKWPDHDAVAWNRMKDEARDRVKPEAAAPIVASDRDAGAVSATAANAARAGVESSIEISERAISAAHYPEPGGWIVTNPPYGLRVGEAGPLRNLYSQLGRIVRDGAPAYHLALLSADKALESEIRLDLTEVFHTTNGGIPVRLLLSRGKTFE